MEHVLWGYAEAVPGGAVDHGWCELHAASVLHLLEWVLRTYPGRAIIRGRSYVVGDSMAAAAP